MRVLLTTRPGIGCLDPLLPIASALTAEGHEVAFAASPAFAEEVTAYGYAFFGTGLAWQSTQPDYIETLCYAAGGIEYPPLTGMERFEWVVERLFIEGASRSMLGDLLEVAAVWQPDIVVREALEFAGCLVAERLGVPHASVAAASNSALDQRAQLARPLARLRAEFGLPPDPACEMPYRSLHLCFEPPGFHGRDATFPATARFLRHADAVHIRDAQPPWVDDLGDRPLVVVSMGTVFHRTAGVYEAIVAGLREEPLQLVVALGYDQDPARLGPQPSNVRVERYVPLPLVLSRCSALVTHGGFNSVKQALSHGVPMVIVPLSGEQPYSAERCAALGVAEGVGPQERTPQRAREATARVLDDERYRTAAEQVRAAMAKLQPAECAVELLANAVRERGGPRRRGARAARGTRRVA